MKHPWPHVKGSPHYPANHQGGIPDSWKRMTENTREIAYASQKSAQDQLRFTSTIVPQAAGVFNKFEDATYAIQGKQQPDQMRWDARKAAMRPPPAMAKGQVFGNTQVGTAFVPEEFWNYVERRREEVLFTEFEKWKLAQIDFGNEPHMDWWRKTFPDLVERKLKSLDYDLEIQKRVAKMNVTGINNMDDLWFLWNLRQSQNADIQYNALTPIPDAWLKPAENYLNDNLPGPDLLTLPATKPAYQYSYNQFEHQILNDIYESTDDDATRLINNRWSVIAAYPNVVNILKNDERYAARIQARIQESERLRGKR